MPNNLIDVLIGLEKITQSQENISKTVLKTSAENNSNSQVASSENLYNWLQDSVEQPNKNQTEYLAKQAENSGQLLDSTLKQVNNLRQSYKELKKTNEKLSNLISEQSTLINEISETEGNIEEIENQISNKKAELIQKQKKAEQIFETFISGDNQKIKKTSKSKRKRVAYIEAPEGIDEQKAEADTTSTSGIKNTPPINPLQNRLNYLQSTLDQQKQNKHNYIKNELLLNFNQKARALKINVSTNLKDESFIHSTLAKELINKRQELGTLKTTFTEIKDERARDKKRDELDFTCTRHLTRINTLNDQQIEIKNLIIYPTNQSAITSDVKKSTASFLKNLESLTNEEKEASIKKYQDLIQDYYEKEGEITKINKEIKNLQQQKSNASTTASLNLSISRYSHYSSSPQYQISPLSQVDESVIKELENTKKELETFNDKNRLLVYSAIEIIKAHNNQLYQKALKDLAIAKSRPNSCVEFNDDDIKEAFERYNTHFASDSVNKKPFDSTFENIQQQIQNLENECTAIDELLDLSNALEYLEQEADTETKATVSESALKHLNTKQSEEIKKLTASISKTEIALTNFKEALEEADKTKQDLGKLEENEERLNHQLLRQEGLLELNKNQIRTTQVSIKNQKDIIYNQTKSIVSDAKPIIKAERQRLEEIKTTSDFLEQKITDLTSQDLSNSNFVVLQRLKEEWATLNPDTAKLQCLSEALSMLETYQGNDNYIKKFSELPVHLQIWYSTIKQNLEHQIAAATDASDLDTYHRIFQLLYSIKFEIENPLLDEKANQIYPVLEEYKKILEDNHTKATTNNKELTTLEYFTPLLEKHFPLPILPYDGLPSDHKVEELQELREKIGELKGDGEHRKAQVLERTYVHAYQLQNKDSTFINKIDFNKAKSDERFAFLQQHRHFFHKYFLVPLGKFIERITGKDKSPLISQLCGQTFFKTTSHGVSEKYFDKQLANKKILVC